MNKLLFYFLLVFISFSLRAKNLSQSFPAGSGSKYEIIFKDQPEPTELSIYVAATRTDSLFIEFFMETKGIIPVQLWQQFEIEIHEGKSKVKAGYLYAKDLKKPEIIPSQMLKEESGIPLNDFLIFEKGKIPGKFIAEEIVEIAAGSTKTKHYQISKNDQTLDFWISEEAKPIRLVMLTSKNSKNPDQNYSIQMTNLIENKKSKIIPEEATSLTEKGLSIIQKMETVK